MDEKRNKGASACYYTCFFRATLHTAFREIVVLHAGAFLFLYPHPLAAENG